MRFMYIGQALWCHMVLLHSSILLSDWHHPNILKGIALYLWRQIPSSLILMFFACKILSPCQWKHDTYGGFLRYLYSRIIPFSRIINCKASFWGTPILGNLHIWYRNSVGQQLFRQQLDSPTAMQCNSHLASRASYWVRGLLGSPGFLDKNTVARWVFSIQKWFSDLNGAETRFPRLKPPTGWQFFLWCLDGLWACSAAHFIIFLGRCCFRQAT